MSFKVTKQTEYWPHLAREQHAYRITHKLLADCIGCGAGASGGRNGRIAGFSYGKQLGYAFLAYLIGQALGFRRLPFCDDRIYLKYLHDSSLVGEGTKTIKDLSEAEIGEMIDEVRRIYEHTQAKLKAAGLSTVYLRRQVVINGNGYAETIMTLKDCANILGHQTVTFEMDTLNSFGDEGAYKHLADVTIEHGFKAEDIFCCSALIDSTGRGDLMETGEWIAINRSPTGLVEMPVSAISYDERHYTRRAPKTREAAEQFMSQNQPFHDRNLTLPEHAYGTHGKQMSLRKKIGHWLLSDEKYQ